MNQKKLNRYVIYIVKLLIIKRFLLFVEFFLLSVGVRECRARGVEYAYREGYMFFVFQGVLPEKGRF